jgi:hypothetical protein
VGRDLTGVYARAADAERRADPELGGVAIRLLREDQLGEGGLVQTGYSETGFIVYTPREAQGEMIANARLYPTEDGLTERAIARAEKFDVIMDEAGDDFLRYRVKDAPTPTGATREFKMIVAQVRDPSPFRIPDPPLEE